MKTETSEPKSFHRRSPASPLGRFLDEPFEAGRKIGRGDFMCILFGTPTQAVLSILSMASLGTLLYLVPSLLARGRTTDALIFSGGVIIFLPAFISMFALARRDMRIVGLLRFGNVGYATVDVIGASPSHDHHGKPLKVEYTYELSFDDEHGRARTATVRSSQSSAVLDDDVEQILYEKDNPKNAVLIQGLEHTVAVSTGEDRIIIASPLRWIGLILPGLLALLIILAPVYWLDLATDGALRNLASSFSNK